MPAVKFIGRSAELSVLNDILAGVEQREYGGLAMVKGTAGIGKSRLIEELASNAASNNVQPVWAHCSSVEGAPPLWPWIQLLRTLVSPSVLERLTTSQPSSIQRIANHITEFSHWTSESSKSESAEPGIGQFLLYDAIRNVIREVASESPLLILIEDFHWADDPSVAVLELILETPGARNIELVVTIRDDPLSAHLYSLPSSITSSSRFTSIVLTSLDQTDTEELFTSLVTGPIDDEALAEVWNITGGNPLFIREFAAAWKPGTEVESVAVPSSAAESIESRLRSIPASDLRVVEYGSVLGNEFDLTRLSAVMVTEGTDRDSLAETLRTGLDLGFIEEKAGSTGWFRFTHDVIRQTVYTRLSNSERAKIHRQVAEGLETLPDQSPGEHAAEISSHWQRAGVTGDLGRSAQWALLAGKDALNSYSFEAAHRFFEHARQAAHQVGSDDAEAEGLAGAGEALAPMGREQEAIEFLKLAFNRFTESGQIDRAIKVAQVTFGGAVGQVQMAQIYEQALELIDPESLEAARIQAPLARVVAIELGDFNRGRSLLKTAADTARRSGDRQLESVTAGYGVQIAAFAGKWSDCAVYCQQALALQGEADDPYSAAIAAMLLAGIRSEDGRMQEADALIAEARDLAERSGNLLRIVSADLLETRLAHYRCQWDRIARVLDRAEMESPSAERILAVSALCSYLVGNFDEGESKLQKYLNIPQETRRGTESPDAQFFPLIARSTLDSEHIAIVKDAANAAEKSPSEFIKRRGLVAHGWMAVEENEPTTAARVRKGLQGAELLHDEKSLLPALAHVCGDIAEAAQEYERQIDLLSSNEHLLSEAWTRYDFARLLIEHPEIRPDSNTQKFATDTRTLALRLGLTPLVARIDQLLGALGITRTPFDLTRRELDVLGLVAQGMTNNEIASQLVVSPHTVNRHLGNIFTKLGVSSRAAATDLAHQRSLV